MFYLKSIQSEMVGLKRRLDVADFRFNMLLWDIHKQVSFIKYIHINWVLNKVELSLTRLRKRK